MQRFISLRFSGSFKQDNKFKGIDMCKPGLAFAVVFASFAVAPASQAAGGFFISGQGGQAEFSDTNFSDDSANFGAVGLGYRWQFGKIMQLGAEFGAGKLGELQERISEDYFPNQTEDNSHGEITQFHSLESRFLYAGANTRFQFGVDSRWFGIARLGYIRFDEKRFYGSTDFFSLDGQSYSYRNDIAENETQSANGAYFGVGIGVDVTPNMNFSLNHIGYAYSPTFADEFGYDDGLYSTSSSSLGLEVRF